MELKYRLRPTMMHTNARFRGPTEALKYTNMLNEAVHDLILLSTVMDRNREKGQSNYIEHNFSQYVNGEGNEVYANIPAVTTLATVLAEKIEEVDLTDATWTKYGDCQVSGTKNNVVLSTAGTTDPSGISRVIDVEEGEILYLRIAIEPISGTKPFFSLGSEDVNRGEGIYQTFSLSNGESTGYVDAMIRCRHRESITINIDLTRGAESLAPKSVRLSEIQVLQLKEEALQLAPTNTTIKSRINHLANEITNLQKYL